MKVGSVVLSTEQGLGYLAKDFYDNGIIDDVFVWKHGSRINHFEWYPNRLKREDDLFRCDVLLFFETPFNWSLISEAQKRGIVTVLMPMYECTNNPLPVEPDLILSPSALDKKYYPSSVQVVVPVGKKWKLRKKAKVFVHNAGNGGLGGRNGTKELVDSLSYIQSPIKLIIRSQREIPEIKDDRVEVRVGTFDDIWSEGDVFVFPEKFNGLSLPLQEAFASGMLVMAGDRFPMNEWLPKEPLIPVSGYHKERIAVEFDCAEYDPKEIAKTIDLWYNRDISGFSRLGKEWGQANSWSALAPFYKKLLKNE